jgi:hypothetical protein
MLALNRSAIVLRPKPPFLECFMPPTRRVLP